MNMRNINVITALSVPGKTVSDDFIQNPSMNKLVSDGSVKKINYSVLYESGITPPLCEVSAPEPDAGGGGTHCGICL